MDQIWKKDPDIAVTGVDLCQEMLEQLRQKHPEKKLTAVCRDYFQYDFGSEKWDAPEEADIIVAKKENVFMRKAGDDRQRAAHE